MSGPTTSVPTAAPTAAATPTRARPTPNEEGRTFTDDFTDESSGWALLLGTAPGLSGGYSDGLYRLTLDGDPRSVALPSPVLVEPGEADVVVSVDVEGEGHGRYGLFCRGDEDQASRYAAVIDASGVWVLFRDREGEVEVLAGTEQPSATIDGDGPNRVELSCRGGRAGAPAQITLTVNGKELAAERDNEGLDSRAVRRVGLFATLDSPGERLDVAYRDFSVLVVDDQDATDEGDEEHAPEPSPTSTTAPTLAPSLGPTFTAAPPSSPASP